MKKNYIYLSYFLILSFKIQYSQNVNVNDNYSYSLLREMSLTKEKKIDFSFNIRPIDSRFIDDYDNYKKIISNKKENILIKTLGIDYFIEYNSKTPYNRNNGTMIPNRGYQHIISPGVFIKIGPLNIQLKPEHHFSENKSFDGFWDGHYPIIWKERYKLWNRIDMPVRHGEKNHNKTTIGQSSVSLEFKNLSIGFSNENLWWGPSIRNSIMMSNHASGFKHISFKTLKPFNTFIGNFEWQIVSGRLENSGHEPPRTDYEYAGRKLFIDKINQRGNPNDWRYFQGLVLSYSPKWIHGLSLGFIRWVQMYSALLEGRYFWIDGDPTYFPIFQNLFRKSDVYADYEAQTDQAAGIFMKWLWDESQTEVYFEYHFNDAKQNLRDLLLDTDHSRAATIGIQKVFNINKNKLLFNWEWTQMEQNATRLIRNAGSWYEHSFVFDGYTNKGEVLGSSIGPGSNSHYLSLSLLKNKKRIGLGFEVIDHDNDFYHNAFSSARDPRRYWKDFNLHINYNKIFEKFSLSSNFVFIRSLNYQWELNDFIEPYYHAGRDLNNIHLSLKINYFIDF